MQLIIRLDLILEIRYLKTVGRVDFIQIVRMYDEFN